MDVNGLLSEIFETRFFHMTRRSLLYLTSTFFTGMAVADITLTLEYLPFLFHISLLPSQEHSWGWAAYLWFHSNFSVVIHNVSVWLTLTVAVWRFIMIKYHTLVPVYCTMERCHFVLLSAYGKY